VTDAGMFAPMAREAPASTRPVKVVSGGAGQDGTRPLLYPRAPVPQPLAARRMPGGLRLPHAVWARCLLLAALFVAFAVGNAALVRADRAVATATPRWPAEDKLYAATGWAVGPARLETAWGVEHISRTYAPATGQAGSAATLVVSAATQAKGLYGKGPATAFLGGGYDAAPPPAGLVPPAPGRGALLLHGGGQELLLLYAHGERRGLLGNGPRAWSLVALDRVLGRANDYYLVRLAVPLDPATRGADVAALARLGDTVFPRLAAWYARPSAKDGPG
jgi:hypothetical protein